MTDQDLDLDRLEALANQKRGRGYREEQTLIGAVPPLVAEVRRLREAITEFAKQHGIGDLESRPLYDAQQRIAYLELEVGWLRRENRRLAKQAATAKAEALRDAADAFEGATINVTIFGDSHEAKWWEAANAARKRLIASMRARADDLERK